MPAALRGLAANLAAGARLALFLRVTRTAFRLDAAQLVLLTVVSALVDVGTDWVRSETGAVLDAAGVGSEMTGFALLLLIAALLAWALREGTLILALPIVVLASLPLTQVASALPTVLARDPDRALWTIELVHWSLVAWFILVLARSAFVALAPHALRWLRALAAGALLAAPLFVPSGLLPEAAWWSTREPAAFDPTNPAAEPVLSLQRELQDEALAALDDHEQGEIDLYFIAFATDGAGESWSERAQSARSVMDGHWGTEGRSLVYLNDTARLTEVPIASVTHLREALEEIAAAIDPEEDVVMVYLAGRSNADGSMAVDLPPLGLVPLSGPGLASLFNQSGIRWRVVVVATCAPEPFVTALADDNTLVFAASASGEHLAECRGGGAPTAFGDALFDEALTTVSTLPAAFAVAQKRLATRGTATTLHVGEAIGAHIERLRSTSGERAGWRGQARR